MLTPKHQMLSNAVITIIIIIIIIIFLNLLYLFLAALLCVGFLQLRRAGLLFVAVGGLLTAVVSLVAEHRLQARGLQQLWHMSSRAQAQQLWHTGLVAPRHVGSSQTRDRAHVPCIGRQILNQCTTREAPIIIFICF